MLKILIDTNIIIDALANRANFAESAKALILSIANNKAKGYITTNTVTDIYYLLRKHYSDSETARKQLETLFTIVDILEISKEDCKKAVRFPMSDFEDAILACCAERCSIDFIATRNTKDFANSPVQAKLPTELTDLLQ